MKNLRPVTFFVVAYCQIVFSQRYNDAIEDNAIVFEEPHFSKPHPISNGDDPPIHSWEFGTEYDDSGENERLVYPDWRFTTRRPSRKQCTSSCPSSSAYQPVCGSDDVTYHNLEQLQCFMRCGIDVNLRQMSPCGAWYSTTASPVRTTTSSISSEFTVCTSQCPATPEYNPVCGSDGATYYNHGKLTCAQMCGKSVQLHRRSPCSKIRATVEPAPLTTTSPKTTLYMCMASCVTDPEYRPVCGTDNQTYFNMSRLQCAIECGVDLSLLKPVACHIQEN